LLSPKTHNVIFQAPDDSSILYPQTVIPASSLSGHQIPKGGPDAQRIPSSATSQEFTDNSPLEFAPFISPESSLFDYNPTTIYDTLLSPTGFEWDMANMWMPSFAPDLWQDQGSI
jgi:hypothetical protein